MAVFQTHVGLTLRWENERVTLEGERVKLLYPLDGEEYNLGEAKDVYDTVKAHYEARKAAFDQGKTPEEKKRLEGAVEMANLRRAREVARSRKP